MRACPSKTRGGDRPQHECEPEATHEPTTSDSGQNIGGGEGNGNEGQGVLLDVNRSRGHALHETDPGFTQTRLAGRRQVRLAWTALHRETGARWTGLTSGPAPPAATSMPSG